MSHAVGVLAMEHIAAGLVHGFRLVGPIRTWPRDATGAGALQILPAEQIAEAIRALVEEVRDGAALDAVGVGFPGIIQSGVVEDSPNLPQVKGFPKVRELMQRKDPSAFHAPATTTQKSKTACDKLEAAEDAERKRSTMSE